MFFSDCRRGTANDRTVHDVLNYIPFAEKSLETMIRTIKKITIREREIRLKNVLMMPHEDGPYFLMVDNIILNDSDCCVLIVKRLLEVNLDELTESHQLMSEKYSWDILTVNDVCKCSVTNLVRTMRGKFIVKNWFQDNMF